MSKIMYLNPVTHRADNDQLAAEMAGRFKSPGTEVHVTSLPVDIGQFDHIEYRAFEGMVTSGIIQATRAAAREGFDALAIGCFYDTGLAEAREISGEMFVTGPCAASCEIAAGLSNRFGIIVGRQKWVHQMQATVHQLGHRDRLSGFYPVDMGVTDFQADHAKTAARLNEAGRKAVEEDHAEALILGCTLETGFHRQLEAALGVPVIDPAVAVLKRAEYGAALKRDCGWVPSRKWSCEPPPEDDIAKAAVIDRDPAYGARIVVPKTKG